ncbi:glucose-1-phosphate adenylyltransferase subunit GlgD [Clostridium sp. AL.422]|uniref:glucose-1-phosphate adenylyltransferase subunit GlgD n=1 Tax=Clostridium TaxID=1485 RepID=UPI00293DE712|nr:MULTISPECIES: glucose-1-phosphate adenylyltransferase subunit GlgD [unclassified Clostridium]MDV4152622.1 glucose-1-phosphate adenylyltransferase subunit GlgD [Clostridium sp. AL.422]
MKNCLGIINLDESESRMGELVRYRTLASVPLSARYRIIDFILSNMTNSGIESIGIFTENKSRSLINHLTNGRPWDLHRKRDGLRIFNFGDYHPNVDDVHNFSDNIEFIEHSRKEYVLISPSYMICNIDFNDVLRYHIKSRNDVTMIYKDVYTADKAFLECQILNINDDNRVISIGENIGREKKARINMEMYIMKIDLFKNIIHECIRSGIHKKIKGYIATNLRDLKVGAFEFDGYLSCVNSIKSYFNTNLDILNQNINKELFYSNKPIYTKSQDEPPTLYTETSLASNSIVANGSYIDGEIKNCIIGRHVTVENGARLDNCIIMQNCKIGKDVVMSNVIADKGTVISENKIVKGTNEYPVTIQRRRIV